jgi:hypothetical protein
LQLVELAAQPVEVDAVVPAIEFVALDAIALDAIALDAIALDDQVNGGAL